MREKIIVTEAVHIPDERGGIRETIMVDVEAERDENGEVYLGGAALRELDRVKARHMGILLPCELKEMRERLNLTQQEMCDLLGLGEKSYSRWETGRDRPTRSMNKILVALYDGRMTIDDLRPIMPDTTFSWTNMFPDYCASARASPAAPVVINLKSNERNDYDTRNKPVAA